ncbi:MAG: phosphoribosyltransferase [Spirochaetia bacterium]
MADNFQDRTDAGKQLANVLKLKHFINPLVLAIPRGGVPVAAEIVRQLKWDFELLIIRKLPLPYNPESGFGAIAEDGSTFVHPFAKRKIGEESRKQIVKEQKQEVKRRVKVLRNNRKLPTISERTVILVDDGLAMGSTMRAAIKCCRSEKAKKIIAAVPVAGPRAMEAVKPLVDEVIALKKPKNFHAVAQVYDKWYDLDDKEVQGIMEEFRAT